jgi:methionine synthase II (cobalamin-independent)
VNQRCEAALADFDKYTAAAGHADETAAAAQSKLEQAWKQADEKAAEHTAALVEAQQQTAAAEANAQRHSEAAAEAQQAASEADAQHDRAKLASQVTMHMCWIGSD